MSSTLRFVAAAAAVSSLIAACGGGGDGDNSGGNGGGGGEPAATAAQGLWNVTTGSNTSATLMVFGDGTYYVVYPAISSSVAAYGGVVQGTGSTSGGVFTSSDGRDFSIGSAGSLTTTPATLVASYTAKQAVNGAIGYASGAETFTGTYDAAYEATPSLAAAAGSYAGTVTFSSGTGNATLVLATTGGVTGSVNGCSFTGTATPRTDANAFNVSLTFGAAPCLYAGQRVNGFGYFSAGTKRFYAAAPTATRTDALLFVGIKP